MALKIVRCAMVIFVVAVIVSTLTKNKKKGSKMKRHKMTKSYSQKVFKKGAILTHKKNLNSNPMRGGIRL